MRDDSGDLAGGNVGVAVGQDHRALSLAARKETRRSGLSDAILSASPQVNMASSRRTNHKAAARSRRGNEGRVVLADQEHEPSFVASWLIISSAMMKHASDFSETAYRAGCKRRWRSPRATFALEWHWCKSSTQRQGFMTGSRGSSRSLLVDFMI
jgi:hypothetical protein